MLQLAVSRTVSVPSPHELGPVVQAGGAHERVAAQAAARHDQELARARGRPAHRRHVHMRVEAARFPPLVVTVYIAL